MPLRFRQVHLDFHTSEQIPGIGSEFVAEEFVETLQRARVDSITLFSRCHHGMIYHDTRFPAKHPNLACNLLPLQIEACHKADIRCPVYITVGWDEYIARTEPGWRQIGADGKPHRGGPLDADWKTLCFASPYIDYVVEQTEEVLDLLGDECDGLFFDIIHQWAAHSVWCMEEYRKLGLDPRKPEDVARLKVILESRFKERMTSAVRAKNQAATIFYNAGHVYPNVRDVLGCYTHLEIESLPSGGWGYAHFPVNMRYARQLGIETLGMTGKFAKTWGHFNSYKPQAALEYECFHMLALGAKCSVGDQLHPSGRLDPATYDLISAVYEQVEQKEPWCEDAEHVAEIGVFNPEALGLEDGRVDTSSLGAYRALVEGRHQFDFIDGQSDWNRYALIVLPDKIPLDPALARKTNDFVAVGGSLLLSHQSGLDASGERFVIEGMPCAYLGDLPYSPDFLALEEPLRFGREGTLFVMYDQGSRVDPTEGAEVLARIHEPYFNRSYERFCSHHHTPPARLGPNPGILSKGRIVYFAHPVFGTYARHGMTAHRDTILRAVSRLLPRPLLTAQGPTSLHVSWMRQPAKRRSVIHLLHYIPERKSLAADIVEDAIPLHNVDLTFRHEMPARSYLAPEGLNLEVMSSRDGILVRVPEVRGHAMVVLED